ncbi:gas vesicle protein GvpN [Phormidium sp. FACHB-1136]|uniref:gas vesicle protein GvpN n=1 Tax=Phormidium sp. FACHB-1136 TaxID=2692848 RepID=UPI00321F6B2A
MNTVLQARPRNFVSTPTLERTAFRTLRYLKSGYSVHLKGPAGTGKTTLALHLADLLGRPIMLLFGDDEFKTSDLIGSQSGYTRKKVVDNYIHSVMKVEDELRHNWIDSRLTLACREGFTLVYDEFNRSRPEVNNVLLSALEEKLLVLPPTQNRSEYIRVSPHFRAIFTSNPEEYCGVHGTQDALQDRLITINMPEPDELAQQQILTQKVGLDPLAAQQIVRIVRMFQADAAPDMVSSLRPSLMIATICNDHGIIPLAENSDFRDVCSDILLTRSKHPLPEATRRLWDLFNQFVASQVGVAEQLQGSQSQRAVRLHGEEDDGEDAPAPPPDPVVVDAAPADDALVNDVTTEEPPVMEAASVEAPALEAPVLEDVAVEETAVEEATVEALVQEEAVLEESVSDAISPMEEAAVETAAPVLEEAIIEAENATEETADVEAIALPIDPVQETPAFEETVAEAVALEETVPEAAVPEAVVLEETVPETPASEELATEPSDLTEPVVEELTLEEAEPVVAESALEEVAVEETAVFEASIPQEEVFWDESSQEAVFLEDEPFLEDSTQEAPAFEEQPFPEDDTEENLTFTEAAFLDESAAVDEIIAPQTMEDEATDESITAVDAVSPAEPAVETIPLAAPEPMISVPVAAVANANSDAFAPVMVDSPTNGNGLTNGNGVVTQPSPQTESPIEERIFNFLDTVGSASFSRIETDLGLTRFQVVNALKSMLDQGLIEKGADGQRPSVYQIRAEYQELL